MKYNIDIIVFICVIMLLYTMPSALIGLSNTFIGKLVFLLILVSLTLHSTLSGILVALLLVLMAEYTYTEGFTGKKGMAKKPKQKKKYIPKEKKNNSKNKHGTTSGHEQLNFPRHPQNSGEHPVSRPSEHNKHHNIESLPHHVPAPSYHKSPELKHSSYFKF